MNSLNIRLSIFCVVPKPLVKSYPRSFFQHLNFENLLTILENFTLHPWPSHNNDDNFHHFYATCVPSLFHPDFFVENSDLFPPTWGFPSWCFRHWRPWSFLRHQTHAFSTGADSGMGGNRRIKMGTTSKMGDHHHHHHYHHHYHHHQYHFDCISIPHEKWDDDDDGSDDDFPAPTTGRFKV